MNHLVRLTTDRERGSATLELAILAPSLLLLCHLPGHR